MQKNVNGHSIELIPIKTKCTYHFKNEKGVCRNCNDTMEYISGYYLIVEKDGQKIGFTVDTLNK